MLFNEILILHHPIKEQDIHSATDVNENVVTFKLARGHQVHT